MKATVRCPGSCGELVQGTADGLNFLVTCPIDLYSQVTVDLSPSGRTTPPAGPKTREAVRRTLAYLGIVVADVAIEVKSELPAGKGMASSSADIAAACLATALAAGRTIEPAEICRIALDIEPTDGIFLSGITQIDHVTGKLLRSLGTPPPITIAVLDAGGEVDTIDFNQRSDLGSLNRRKEPEVQRALQLVEQGVRNGDAALVGAGATLSARANQPILCKPALERIIEISRSYGAVGVNAAHSGTVLGVLFDSARAGGLSDCVDAICRECPEVRHFHTVRLVGGGLSIIGGS